MLLFYIKIEHAMPQSNMSKRDEILLKMQCTMRKIDRKQQLDIKIQKYSLRDELKR